VRRPVEVGREVYLRYPSARDADAFVTRTRASRRLHRGWVHAPDSSVAFEAHLRRSRQPDVASFLICRRDDDDLAGVATLSQIFLGNFRNAYLGFYAFEPHARRGYMSEGIGLVLRHAFATLGLHRVEANVQPDNVASMAFVERLGFRREGYSPRYLKIAGRWRDHVRWAILAEEFVSRDARGR
jgi:[ribosomal protein S5]-alanine N-acetyltransferase